MAPPRRPAPLVVEGIVLRNAAGGKGSGGWDLIVNLQPWRLQAAKRVSLLPMRLELPLEEADLSAWMNRLPDGAPVRVNLTTLPRREGQSWQARGTLPLEVLQQAQVDPAVQSARAALDAPVVVEDPLLGKLTLNRQFGWFEGERIMNGGTYTISVTQTAGVDNRKRDLRDIRRAGTVVSDFEKRLSAIQNAILGEMLPLYNDGWREDREELTADAFLARIRLVSAVTYPDGHATLYFDDGDLFYRHTIEVRLGKHARVREVCLSG